MAMAFFVSVTLGITACGPGGGNGSPSNGASSSQISNDWAAVETEGFVQGGPYANTKIISIDPKTLMLTLMIPIPLNPLATAMVSVPIPKVPGAVVSLTQDPTTMQWYLEYTMPLSLLVKGLNYSNPTTLPNGDPLPGVPGGELPRIEATLEVKNYTFNVYGSVVYFAVFLPIPKFNSYISLTYPIMNKSKTKILGYASILPQKNGFDGGAYVSFAFPPEFQRVLDDLF